MTNIKQKEIILKAFPFLEEEDYINLITISAYEKIKNKETIVPFNHKSVSMYFVLDGLLRGYFINEKKEDKNIFLRPTGTFTGSPNVIFLNKTSKFSIESVGVTHILRWNYYELETLASTNPNIFKFLLAAYQENLINLIERVEDLIDKTPEERYHAFITRYPEMYEKIFNKHVANYLGITPVSLSRIKKRKADNH